MGVMGVMGVMRMKECSPGMCLKAARSMDAGATSWLLATAAATAARRRVRVRRVRVRGMDMGDQQCSVRISRDVLVSSLHHVG